jgi:hypothetical protein
VRTTFAFLVCWTLAGGAADAQTYHGGVRGSIRDADGVVPGVDVTLTNEQTNISRSVLTNEHGEYAFTSVDPGTYRVRAMLQGFKTVERSCIRVGTQDFLVIDLTLEVGTIEQTVTVTGRAPAIDHATASHGAALDAVALQALPAVNRGAFTLGASVPTVIFSSGVQFTRQQDQSSSTRLISPSVWRHSTIRRRPGSTPRPLPRRPPVPGATPRASSPMCARRDRSSPISRCREMCASAAPGKRR